MRTTHLMIAARLLTFVACASIALGATGFASAQSGPPFVPPPVGPPVGPPVATSSGTPIIVIVAHTLHVQFGYQDLPYDFRFVDRIVGSGFKPNERVTITTKNIQATPVTVTADAAGGINAEVPFTWEFCGPSSQRQAAPEFVARGNEGSTAGAQEKTLPCPLLLPLGVGTVARPPGKPGGALARPATPSQLLARAASSPTAGPSIQPFTVEGFGFVAGEQVHVQVLTHIPQPSGAVTAAQTRSDSLGRVRVQLRVSAPPPCAVGSGDTRIEASGDAGTSVGAPLFWFQGMLMCARYGAPGAHGAPQTPASTPVPNTDGILSLSLHPRSARPGAQISAVVESGRPGRVTIAVSYPGGARSRKTAAARAGTPVRLRWIVPRSARPGLARVTLRVQPGGLSLQSAFRLK